MSKSRNDEAYDKGYEEGKNADAFQQVVKNLADVKFSWEEPDSSGTRAREGGYRDGVQDRYDNNNSHYQGGGSSDSDCFITTATLLSIGKPDDCEELNTFRNFRDRWLSKIEGGKQLISEYYEIAPKIVNSINARSDSRLLYSDLWINDLKPCLSLINNGLYEEAKLAYSEVVSRLKQQYL